MICRAEVLGELAFAAMAKQIQAFLQAIDLK